MRLQGSVFMAISLWCFIRELEAKSLRKREAPVDRNDPVALAEAIAGLMEGTIPFPQLNPQNLPPSSFKCEDQQYPGFYADTELECQVFHICEQAKGIDGIHVCPNMTIYSQEFHVCMWAPTVDCADAPNLYRLNENLYKSPDIDYWGNKVERYNPVPQASNVAPQTANLAAVGESPYKKK